MATEVLTRTKCDVPGCMNFYETKGSVGGIPFIGNWIELHIAKSANSDAENKTLCPLHSKQIMTILVGKKVRGKDKKPRNKGKSSKIEASEVQTRATPVPNHNPQAFVDAIVKKIESDVMKSPKPEKARKGKIAKAIEESLERIDPNVCEPGEPQFQKCPKCPERPKCTKDGGAALDCYDTRHKSELPK